MTHPARLSASFLWSGYLLGFALGGFFDGILLHQILQWHHLLSLVEGVEDLRSQVLFDGLFHALMYVVAAAGLALLVLRRGELVQGQAARTLVGCALIGFGTWHLLDGVLSHWIVGIHRIKLDSPYPLFWDLIWFFFFGVLPVVVGWLVRRHHGTGGPLSGRAAAIGMAVAVLGGAPWADTPPAGSNTAIVIFHPRVDDGSIMSGIVASGGSLLWESRGIWAVRWDGSNHSRALYRHGALFVGTGFVAAGCLAWSQV
jgi:uncharacterized membrane protein